MAEVDQEWIDAVEKRLDNHRDVLNGLRARVAELEGRADNHRDVLNVLRERVAELEDTSDAE
jgi:BMFP domain-containing protein YqiC